MNHPDYRQIIQLVRRRQSWSADEPLTFPEEDADLFFLPFESRNGGHLLGRSAYRCARHDLAFGPEPVEETPADAEIAQNLHCHYPLLRAHEPPGRRTRARHLILVFHGLNERSFSKYVPWAYQLWRATGAAVVLFPLPFHIHRVLPRWGQEVQAHLKRRQAAPGNENCHAFNAVISERLESRPERFFWGGLQAYHDVLDLIRLVRSGAHQHVDPAARIDLIGYSAGGYLTLGLLLVDQDGLLSRSHGVVFESGAALRDTTLSSRFIVDLSAEIALMKLFIRFTAKYANARLEHWLAEHEEGRCFRALCGAPEERRWLEARLRQIAPRLLGVSNENDVVIPAGGILNLLQGIHRDTGVRVAELALGVHENPFGCADYAQQDRKFVTQFLDLERYGPSFERFIETASAMLG